MAIKNRIKDIPDCLFIFYCLNGMINPQGLFKWYSCLAKKKNLNKLYFILSFDCDTSEDIGVALDVHSKVMDLGITPAYFVAGQLLEKGEKVYKRIAKTGAEFINHGYTEHTFLHKTSGRYMSCFSYDQLQPAQIREDIVKGDNALRNVLGISPCGFRTPHFGRFQKRHNIIFLHSVLKELGYQFSTSTMPYYGFRYGPVFELFGVKEFPLSGAWTKPLSILDTWNCYGAPGRSLNEMDYLREAKAIAQNFKEKHYCGILNYYADPSHIARKESFFQAITEWARVGYNITYENLLKELS